MMVQDICFLLLISAIVAYLRLVGDTAGFQADQKNVAHRSDHIYNLALNIFPAVRSGLFAGKSTKFAHDSLVFG